MEAITWIGQLIEAFGRLFPRLLLIRATHRAVKWKYGRKVSELKPGLRVYWPLVSEVDSIVVARQTLNLPVQVLMTHDKKQIVVGCLIVYRIKDVVLAIGERNYDVDATVRDVTQAAIVEVCSNSTLDDLLEGVAGDVEKALTMTTRKRLRQFGVFIHRVAITDFSTCKTFKLITNEVAPVAV